MAKLRDAIQNWLVEVVALGFIGAAGWLISLGQAHAVSQNRIDNLEMSIALLRAENRDDHKQIMEQLRK